MENLYLNDPQAKVLLVDPQIAVLIYGRRLGKSTEIIAHLSAKRAFDMPGASFLMLGRTYKQILERTLAATKTGWLKRGYIEDVHYVVGKRPPKNWGQPKYIPSSWEHSISWITGTVFPIGSQDREGLVNSLTCHGLYADEAKFIDPIRFKEDALPVVSAPRSQFPNSPHNRSIILCTSMPALPQGQWLFDYKRLMDEKQIERIIKVALKVEMLKNAYDDATNEGTKRTILSDIRFFEESLRLLRLGNPKHPGCVLYDEASTIANLHIIGLDYIRQQREILGDKFNTEILNIKPKITDQAFYSQLTDKHFVSMVNYTEVDSLGFSGAKKFSCKCDDYNRDAPLLIGMDFGATINCMVTAQRVDEARTINILKNHFVKVPKIQDDVAQDWCDYYAQHRNKRVRFHYDNTGNNKTGNTRETRAQQVKKILEKNGWTVTLCTEGGANVLHDLKHLLINAMLSEKSARYFKIRINEANCEELQESITNTPALEDSKGNTKKNKASERSKIIPPEHATHFGDAFDSIIYGEFSNTYNNMEELINLYSRMM